jgi:hypothetical protein
MLDPTAIIIEKGRESLEMILGKIMLSVTPHINKAQ